MIYSVRIIYVVNRSKNSTDRTRYSLVLVATVNSRFEVLFGVTNTEIGNYFNYAKSDTNFDFYFLLQVRFTKHLTSHPLQAGTHAFLFLKTVFIRLFAKPGFKIIILRNDKGDIFVKSSTEKRRIF